MQQVTYSVKNVIKKLTHVTAVCSSRYEALVKFWEHSRHKSRIPRAFQTSRLLHIFRKQFQCAAVNYHISSSQWPLSSTFGAENKHTILDNGKLQPHFLKLIEGDYIFLEMQACV